MLSSKIRIWGVLKLLLYDRRKSYFTIYKTSTYIGYFDNSQENCKIALRRVIMRCFACKETCKVGFLLYNFTSLFYIQFSEKFLLNLVYHNGKSEVKLKILMKYRK